MADEIHAASRTAATQALSGLGNCAFYHHWPLNRFLHQLSNKRDPLFCPRIFELTGLGAKAALLQSVGIGVTNLSTLSGYG
jgi:hypothetical protein